MRKLQETGMYDYGWRQYMPDIGRWNGIDQLAESYVSTSTYAYVMNNPIMLTDPDGRGSVGVNNMPDWMQKMWGQNWSLIGSNSDFGGGFGGGGGYGGGGGGGYTASYFNNSNWLQTMWNATPWEPTPVGQTTETDLRLPHFGVLKLTNGAMSMVITLLVLPLVMMELLHMAGGIHPAEREF